ncbi:MAG TPA: methyltransferase domain-containing protein [Nitrososphaeraceae archaeon]|nr:methyltransferase domain-containing protein [Nitrososphaeraceae archaeon]
MTYNSVLKNIFEVTEAEQGLQELQLFRHHSQIKSWDTYKMIKMISGGNRESFVLDVGCYESPILPMLKRLGFINLYGCDLVLKSSDCNPNFTNNNNSSFKYHEDYEPIAKMYNDKSYQLSIRNLEDTKYRDQMFDYVTSLSVIEHGVNVENYFREMSRIIKNNGYLLTSTDYWPDKLVNNKNILSKGTPDNIFSRDEIEKLVEIADKNGLKLTEPIDFEYKDKVVRWNSIGLDFTFIFFAMKKE